MLTFEVGVRDEVAQRGVKGEGQYPVRYMIYLLWEMEAMARRDSN